MQNAQNGQQRSNQIYGDIAPQLESEAANPQGYNPQQMAYMNTASQQSLGGGAAATTGQANLEAARTNNAGGFSGAVGSANRATQRQSSQNALGIQEQQANLQQAQKQQALSSLQSLYGTNYSGSTTAANAENQAPNFWQQLLMQGAGSAEKAGAAAVG